MKQLCILALILFAMPQTVTPPEQYAVVYFYRGRDTQDWPKEINVLNPEAVVYLDGQEFLSLPERTFIGFRIPVGRYELSMKRKGTTRPLEVRANQTYYLQIEQVTYPSAYQIIYDAEERSAEEAIRKCYTLKAKKIRLKRFEVITQKPGQVKKDE